MPGVQKKKFQRLRASWSRTNVFFITILNSLDRGKTNLNYEVLLFIFRFILLEFWSFKVIKTEVTFQKGIKHTKKGIRHTKKGQSNNLYQIKRFTACTIISQYFKFYIYIFCMICLTK